MSNATRPTRPPIRHRPTHTTNGSTYVAPPTHTADGNSMVAPHAAAASVPFLDVDRERQSEELEVLKSMYDADLTILQLLVEGGENRSSSAAPFSCVFSIRLAEFCRCEFRLPFGYPSRAHPLVSVEFLHTSDPVDLPAAPSYQSTIERLYAEIPCVDEVVVFQYVEYLKEHVLEVEEQRSTVWRTQEAKRRVKQEQDEHASLLAAEALMAADLAEEKEQRLASFEEGEGNANASASSSRYERSPSGPTPTIYTGEPLTDRKSTFQAHVASVYTVEDTKAVLAELYSHNKIARATHNMFAYVLSSPHGIKIRENDDDGEDMAGSRLAHLLQIMQAENLMVVVSRWYGGIMLGSDRFKHINNVARQSLEAHMARMKHEDGTSSSTKMKGAAGKTSHHAHKR